MDTNYWRVKMGFRLQLPIYLPTQGDVLPSTHLAKHEFYVWQLIRSLSGAVRWPGAHGDSPTPSQTADNCMFSWILGKYQEMLQSITRDDIAPPFRIDIKPKPHEYNDRSLKELYAQSVRVLMHAGYSGCIDPVRIGTEDTYPMPDVMLDHNQALEQLDWKRLRFAYRFSNAPAFTDDLPLLWVPTRRVARWWEEMIDGKPSKTQEILKSDALSLRIARARLAYMKEWGKVRARVLLDFHPPYGALKIF